MRSGRMTRRAVLAKGLWMAGALGTASGALTSCNLPAPQAALCDTTMPLPAYQSAQHIALNWISERVDQGVYANLLSLFHAQYPDIEVYQHIDQDHDALLNALATKTTDIVSLDVVWINEFAQKKLIVPLCDFWPLSERSQYFPIPMQAVTIDGKVYAAIFRMDIGLLFYRTDITPVPPSTWQDLTTFALKSIADKKTQYGYVWQGGTDLKKHAYGEGLLCDYLEVLYAYGGKLDLNDLSTITSSNAWQALTEMVGWIDTISPEQVTQFDEDRSFYAWNGVHGSVAFMRNWPVYYVLSNETKALAGNFNVAPLPGVRSVPGPSCLGGWCLAINAAISRERQEAAWTFIHWMMQEEAQLYAAKANAWLTTLKSTYENPDILSVYPFFSQIPAMLQSAILRPKSPFYTAVSNIFQMYLNQALLHQETPKVALNLLQKDVATLINKEKKAGLTSDDALMTCTGMG